MSIRSNPNSGNGALPIALRAKEGFLRHGRSIETIEGPELALEALKPIVSMSLTRLSLGRLLLSRADLRFTWRNQDINSSSGSHRDWPAPRCRRLSPTPAHDSTLIARGTEIGGTSITFVLSMA